MTEWFRNARRSRLGKWTGCTVLALALGLSAGCAKEHKYTAADDDDDDEDGEERALAGGVDAAISPAEESEESVPSVAALMRDFFTEYGRQTVSRCPCLVSDGAYASVEECEQSVGRLVTVKDCFADAIPDEHANDLRVWFRCVTRAMAAQNACLEASACDAQVSCRIDNAPCPLPDVAPLTSAIEHCPGAVAIAQ